MVSTVVMGVVDAVLVLAWGFLVPWLVCKFSDDGYRVAAGECSFSESSHQWQITVWFVR